MLPGGRLQAAIEVLQDIETRHRPASEALADWGRSHRFAGAGDRAAIGNLVFDALRQKRSLGYRMGSDTPRALALGAFAFVWHCGVEKIDTLLAGDRHAPEALTDSERIAIRHASLQGAPEAVQADVPDWVWPAFQEVFGETALEEGRALAQRAPIDLRVNSLKASRDKVLKALSRFGAVPTPHAALGVRIPPPEGSGRSANVQAEAAFQKGWFEVQDEGSQIAALLSGAAAGLQVADICAGAGGKTLALAALMENKGQLHAYDTDRHRLKAIFDRLKRAGTRNVQVLAAGDHGELAALQDKMDLVFVDAPCTGSGVWRRRPDAKWRLSEQALQDRKKDQAEVLDQAALLTKSGGHVVYVTCSILDDENGRQITAFLERHPDFSVAPLPASDLLALDTAGAGSMLLTPARHATDGFFVARLVRG